MKIIKTEFCFKCEGTSCDINLPEIVLSIERGPSENALCAGCNHRAMLIDA